MTLGCIYRAEDLEYWKARDPLILLRRRLARAGVADDRLEAIEASVEAVMEEAVEFALASPEPSLDEYLAEVDAA